MSWGEKPAVNPKWCRGGATPAGRRVVDEECVVPLCGRKYCSGTAGCSLHSVQ